jgi:outer membrane lipoprotein-sorting protein
MSEPKHDQSDDLLKRAIAATRQLPLPDGPSGAIMSQTLATLREAAGKPQHAFLQRITHMPWTTRASALLAVAASVMIMYVVLSNPAGATRAFADVAQALTNIRTATWKTTSVVEDKGPANKTVTFTAKSMFLAPSHERTETTVEGESSISISDGAMETTLILSPSQKTAMAINFKNVPPETKLVGTTFLGLRDMVANAKSGKAGKVERLGAKTIDGRSAEGYRFKIGAAEITIWADPKTSLPIRVEEKSEGAMFSNMNVNIVMSDFQVDVPLEESLFSLDVPQGYTKNEPMQFDVPKDPFNFVKDCLKLAAEYNGGVFPPTLHGENGFDGILGRAMKAEVEKHTRDSSNADKFKAIADLTAKVAGVSGFLSAVPEEYLHYAGKDVKLGTPDRPILWVTQQNGGRCMVLYADLTMKELPAAEAPKVPATEGAATRKGAE